MRRPGSLWLCLLSLHLGPFSAALGIFAPYQFSCNQYHSLICGPCFHAYARPSTYLLESILRGDSSDKRWDASISASGFTGSGLRARLSNLKAGVGWVTSAALLLAVPCASPPGGWKGRGGRSWGGATQKCRADVLLAGSRVGKEWSFGNPAVAQGGLVRVPGYHCSAGGEGGQPL